MNAGRALLLLALIGANSSAWAQEETPAGAGTDSIRIVDWANEFASLSVDSTAMSPNDGDIGFAYDFSFARSFGNEDGIFEAGKRLSLAVEASSEGKLALQKTQFGLDNITSGLEVGGHLYVNDALPPDPRLQLLIVEALEKDPDQLTQAEVERLRVWNEEISKRARFVSFGLHFNHEATQDFDSHDFALGAGTAFDLATILPSAVSAIDFPFSLLRSGSSSFQPDAPRFYLGVDWVTNLDSTDREADTGATDNELARLTAEAAWRTMILDKLTVRAVYRLWYEIDAPQSVEVAGREFNDLVEITASYPVNPSLDVMVRWADGRVPPNFDSDNVASVGFSLYFGRH